MASNAVDTVFDSLGSMTVLELVELKNKIEEEWGITAAAPVAVAAPGGAPAGGGDGAGDGEEQTSFDVVLSAGRPVDPLRQPDRSVDRLRKVVDAGATPSSAR